MKREYEISDVVEIGPADELIRGKMDIGSDDNARFPPEGDEFEG